jgi:hypothetical protein
MLPKILATTLHSPLRETLASQWGLDLVCKRSHGCSITVRIDAVCQCGSTTVNIGLVCQSGGISCKFAICHYITELTICRAPTISPRSRLALLSSMADIFFPEPPPFCSLNALLSLPTSASVSFMLVIVTFTLVH